MRAKIILILIMVLISSCSTVFSFSLDKNNLPGENAAYSDSAVTANAPAPYDSYDTPNRAAGGSPDISHTDYQDKGKEGKAVFESSPVPEEIRKKIIGVSWNEDAPCSIDDMAYLKVSYIDFNGKTQVGCMIVHKLVAEDVIEIFKELYDKRFPIEKIRLIDDYGADDNASMNDNNTSALCVRKATGGSELSVHAYGIAIDLNPVQNPYVKGDIVYPQKGRDYLDRTNIRKGMITENDDCFNAFAKRGWIWGGNWKALKDYQHFQKDIVID